MNHSKAVTDLMHALHEMKIIYCHWKSTIHLKATYSGETDLDLLIARSDASSFRQLMFKQGYVRFDTASMRTYPGVEDYLKYDKILDRWIHVHAHYQLVLGDRWVKGYRLPWETKVLDNRIWDDVYLTYTISPEHEFIMFILRMHYKYRRPTKIRQIRAELMFLRSKIEKLERLSSNINALGLGDVEAKVLFHWLKTEGQTKLLAQAFVRVIGGRFLRFNIKYFWYLRFLRYCYRIFVETNRRLLGREHFGRRRLVSGGLVVALVGMDGAGKTSAIDRNKTFFARQMNVAKISLGGGKSGASTIRMIFFLMHEMKLYFRRRTMKPNQESIKKPHMSTVQTIYHVILAWDRLYRLRQIHKMKSNGCIVFVDRWPQSGIPRMFDGPRCSDSPNSLLSKLLSQLEKRVLKYTKINPPDIVIKLAVSPDIAQKRKPGEISINDSLGMSQQFKNLEYQGSKIIVIDADQNTKNVDKQIRSHVFVNV
jgi:thymidylate kinase